MKLRLGYEIKRVNSWIDLLRLRPWTCSVRFMNYVLASGQLKPSRGNCQKVRFLSTTTIPFLFTSFLTFFPPFFLHPFNNVFPFISPSVLFFHPFDHHFIHSSFCLFHVHSSFLYPIVDFPLPASCVMKIIPSEHFLLK